MDSARHRRVPNGPRHRRYGRWAGAGRGRAAPGGRLSREPGGSWLSWVPAALIWAAVLAALVSLNRESLRRCEEGTLLFPDRSPTSPGPVGRWLIRRLDPEEYRRVLAQDARWRQEFAGRPVGMGCRAGE